VGRAGVTGVLLRDVLADVAGRSDAIRAVALNDYAVEIPMRDAFDHDVIVAYQKDGETLTVRDRGPLWVIYPWADDAALRTEEYYARSIWQLNKLEVVAN